MPRWHSAASMAARTTLSRMPGRVAAMPAAWAAAVASAARRSSAMAASSCTRRSSIKASASGSSTGARAARADRAGPASGPAPRRSRDRSPGRVAVAAPLPASAAAQIIQRLHRDTQGGGDLGQGGLGAVPQGRVGFGGGRVHRPVRPVEVPVGAPEGQTEQVQEVALRPVRVRIAGVVARSRRAGHDQRRSASQTAGQLLRAAGQMLPPRNLRAAWASIVPASGRQRDDAAT